MVVHPAISIQTVSLLRQAFGAAGALPKESRPMDAVPDFLLESDSDDDRVSCSAYCLSQCWRYVCRIHYLLAAVCVLGRKALAGATVGITSQRGSKVQLRASVPSFPEGTPRQKGELLNSSEN